MPPEEVARNVLVSSDAGRLAERLHDYQELGFESLYLHPVGEDDEFIDVFGAEVLPQPRLAGLAQQLAGDDHAG